MAFRPDAPKDGHTRLENRNTQPLVAHRVFANPEVMTEGWYPVFPSRLLRRGKARSFLLGWQRVVLFRGTDGRARALDAFCPHMGADLGNGCVVGEQLRCYFHHWQFDGAGQLNKCGEGVPPRQLQTAAYSVEERYGFIWVYAGAKPLH